MRTTVTLDADTRLLIERLMQERKLSFKLAINEAIRRGLGGSAPGAGASFTEARDLGPARIEITKALSIASELEDDSRARRLAEGR